MTSLRHKELMLETQRAILGIEELRLKIRTIDALERVKQSRIDMCCNVAVGLGVSLAANSIFIPMVTGAPLSTGANVMLGVIYTIISLVRSYCIRRLFNGRGIWESIRCR